MFRRQQSGKKTGNQSYRRQPKGRDISDMHESRWALIDNHHARSYTPHAELVKEHQQVYNVQKKPLGNLVMFLVRMGGVFTVMHASLAKLSTAGETPAKVCHQSQNGFFKPVVEPILHDQRGFGSTSTVTPAL
jgi:hypothetical protein